MRWERVLGQHCTPFVLSFMVRLIRPSRGSATGGAHVQFRANHSQTDPASGSTALHVAVSKNSDQVSGAASLRSGVHFVYVQVRYKSCILHCQDSALERMRLFSVFWQYPCGMIQLVESVD